MSNLNFHSQPAELGEYKEGQRYFCDLVAWNVVLSDLSTKLQAIHLWSADDEQRLQYFTDQESAIVQELNARHGRDWLNMAISGDSIELLRQETESFETECMERLSGATEGATE